MNETVWRFFSSAIGSRSARFWILLFVRMSVSRLGILSARPSATEAMRLLLSINEVRRFMRGNPSTRVISLSERSRTSYWSSAAPKFSIKGILFPKGERLDLAIKGYEGRVDARRRSTRRPRKEPRRSRSMEEKEAFRSEESARWEWDLWDRALSPSGNWESQESWLWALLWVSPYQNESDRGRVEDEASRGGYVNLNMEQMPDANKSLKNPPVISYNSKLVCTKRTLTSCSPALYYIFDSLS